MSVRYFVSKGRRQELARMPARDVGNLDVVPGKYSTNGSDLDTGVPLPPGYFDAQEIPLPAYFQHQGMNPR